MSKSQSETGSSSSPRTKPSTRSSIRHSLNLAGKAFADVINKDSRDVEKVAKKTKDTSSRRLSAIGLRTAAPRTSMGEVRPPSQTTRRVGTPDSKAVTRRRMSAVGQDGPTTKPVDSVVGVTRSSLRPRNNPPASSALPKYRPKSALVEVSKPPSPRTGSRRRFSSSDDEKEDKRANKEAGRSPSPSQKVSRPISPLPHRVALKANLTSAVNATPPTTPSKVKIATPSTTRTSPSRPTKHVKTTSSVSSFAPHSAIIRPPSSSSSSSSFIPHTPKTPGVKTVTAVRRSSQENNSRLSPSRASPRYLRNESPLARHSRKDSKDASPAVDTATVGNMSHISEGNSEDSEADDVELLLAPTAALGAPTPAMPRIQAPRNRKRLPPRTPTRANLLPTRANLSYLSPLPPDADSGSSSLRPPQQQKPGTDRAARGSILSWEQLASEASRTLGEDEIENMLSDIPAPFRSGAVSPSPSTMDIPESPCLSALSSPGGYGSISQVLLPDVTPSPAVHHNMQRYDMPMSPEAPAVDAAIVTLLRLQLASAENTAKERLYQLQSMEEEIHNLKEARTREAQELTKQVTYMEEQIRGNMEMRELAEEERTAYTNSLEDQLRQVQVLRDQAVETAIIRSQESARASQEAALKALRGSCEIMCSARVAASDWATVHDMAEMELGTVQGDRQVLSVLLTELDQICRIAC